LELSGIVFTPSVDLDHDARPLGAGHHTYRVISDVVVEVELSAAVRLSLAGFALGRPKPLVSSFVGPVIRLGRLAYPEGLWTTDPG
jgi:hypothetical protein